MHIIYPSNVTLDIYYTPFFAFVNILSYEIIQKKHGFVDYKQVMD